MYVLLLMSARFSPRSTALIMLNYYLAAHAAGHTKNNEGHWHWLGLAAPTTQLPTILPDKSFLAKLNKKKSISGAGPADVRYKHLVETFCA